MSSRDDSPERPIPKASQLAVDVVDTQLFRGMFRMETISHWPERQRYLFGIEARKWYGGRKKYWQPTELLAAVVVPKEDVAQLREGTTWEAISEPMIRLSNTEESFLRFWMTKRSHVPIMQFIEPRIAQLTTVIKEMEEDLQEAKDQLSTLTRMSKKYDK